MENFKLKYESSLSSLDKFQKEFVENQSQIIKCLANAGSGKTHSSIIKVVDYVLNQNIKPEDIVLISYTTKAAKLLRERYSSFFELSTDNTTKTPSISTIHSFCFKLLNEQYKKTNQSSSYTILNDYKNYVLLKEIITSNLEDYLGLTDIALEKNIIYSIYYLYNEIANACETSFFLKINLSSEATLSSISDSPDYSICQYSYSANRAKVNGFNYAIEETVEQKRKEYFLKFNSILSNTKKIDESYLKRLSYESLSSLFTMVFLKFTETKLKMRKLSFSDIIYYTFLYNNQYKTLGSNFKICIVDEAQDLDYVNFSVFKSLVDTHKCKLTLVGDPKQSLYSFRLADPDILDKLDLFFPAENVSTNYLLSNYRSNENLVKLSNGFSRTLENTFDVQDSVSIKDKQKNSFVFKPFDYPEQEYDFIVKDIAARKTETSNYSDFAAIARTNQSLQEIEPFFIKMKIPYKIKYDARSFFNQSSFKLLYNIYSILLSSSDIDSLLEIFENFKGIGEKTLKKIRSQFISKFEANSKYSLFDQDFVKSISSYSSVSSIYSVFLVPLKEHFQAYDFTLLTLHRKIQTLVKSSFSYLEQTDDNSVKYSYNQSEIYFQMTLDQIDRACLTINSLYESYNTDSFFKNMLEIERMYEIYNALSTTQVDKNNDSKDCVTLSTIHSFKGMESDIVYFFNTSSLSPFKVDDKVNDLCCMYVAVTRAKSKMVITSSKQLRTFDRQLRKSIFNPYLNFYLEEVKKMIS